MNSVNKFGTVSTWEEGKYAALAGPDGKLIPDLQEGQVAPSRRPTIEYKKIIQDSGDPGYINRVLLGTACTGLVRIEWVAARYNAVQPVNWSHVEMTQQIPTFYPLRYQVADAQNLIVKQAIEGDFQWVLLLEHDVVVQPTVFMQFNEYMHNKRSPVVSGLYFTRSRPSDPLVFRGRGVGVYDEWEQGDVVYCDGIPTGLLLIHVGLLREMWNDSPDYAVGGAITRRVFNTPRAYWKNPQTGYVNMAGGTSDLDWCTRVIEGDYLRKAGWNEYMDNLEDEKYPFICDTGIFARHVNPNGEMFP